MHPCDDACHRTTTTTDTLTLTHNTQTHTHTFVLAGTMGFSVCESVCEYGWVICNNALLKRNYHPPHTITFQQYTHTAHILYMYTQHVPFIWKTIIREIPWKSPGASVRKTTPLKASTKHRHTHTQTIHTTTTSSM